MTANDDTVVMTTVTDDDQTQIMMSPLVARVMEASVAHTQSVTNALIDNLTYQEAELRARLELVCERVTQIANRPYVANPFLYLEALRPSQEDVQERMLHNGYTKG